MCMLKRKDVAMGKEQSSPKKSIANVNCVNYHDKVFNNKILLGDPVRRHWICRDCGQVGYLEGRRCFENYENLKKRFYGNR